jgi:hypothetical protein
MSILIGIVALQFLMLAILYWRNGQLGKEIDRINAALDHMGGQRVKDRNAVTSAPYETEHPVF